MPKSNLSKLALLSVIAAVSFASCTRNSQPSGTRPVPQQTKADTSAAKKPVIFSVAASSRDLMEELAKEFAAMRGVEVKINSGPSNGLASQILSGAPADLFLSANEQWAKQIEVKGMAVEIQKLLGNRLVLVVPLENRANVQQPSDLNSSPVQKLVLAGEQVPAGIYGGQALTTLGLFDRLSAEGKIARAQDVRMALHFVERGEADAGIVYATDVANNPKVKVVHTFDPKLHDPIAYVLVLVKQEPMNPEARELFTFLQRPSTEQTYRQFGFTRWTAVPNSN